MRRSSLFVTGLALAGVASSGAAQAPVDSLVARFYDARSLQPAWIVANGVTPQGTALLDAVSGAEREGLEAADYITPALDSLLHRHLSPDEVWRLDSLLTRLFLAYAWDISRGRIEPSLVETEWTAAPHPTDLVALLEQALDLNEVPAVLQRLTPPHTGYVLLRTALQRYREIAQQGEWPVPLGRRLAAEGYDTTAGLMAAVRQFQALHGLEVDGVAGPATRAELDVPAATRAHQIALNLERWRWLPRSLGDRFILVNSAAFSLELVEGGAVTLTIRAIVGRPDWPTPITSSRATAIVFRPTWTVPRTIAEQEVLPLVERDPTYLAREGFRVTDDSQLVQEPGPTNPLGGMKLVFWTPFNVFIHDTPGRPLFSERWRAFSHGCVRVENAAVLAGRLLPDWPAESIRVAMATGREQWVPLPQPIPVHLVYWTAEPAEDGLVAFAGDSYRWDEKLARALAARSPRLALNGERSPATRLRCSAR